MILTQHSKKAYDLRANLRFIINRYLKKNKNCLSKHGFVDVADVKFNFVMRIHLKTITSVAILIVHYLV